MSKENEYWPIERQYTLFENDNFTHSNIDLSNETRKICQIDVNYLQSRENKDISIFI